MTDSPSISISWDNSISGETFFISSLKNLESLANIFTAISLITDWELSPSTSFITYLNRVVNSGDTEPNFWEAFKSFSIKFSSLPVNIENLIFFFDIGRVISNKFSETSSGNFLNGQSAKLNVCCIFSPVVGCVTSQGYSGPYAKTLAATITAFLSPINKSSVFTPLVIINESNNLSITTPFLIKFCDVNISSSLAVIYLISIFPSEQGCSFGYNLPSLGKSIISLGNLLSAIITSDYFDSETDACL